MLERLIEKENLWDRVKRAEKPVVLYGMGNGADMIIDELNKRGVRVSGVFASDSFVRGQIFRGFKVMKYAEVCEKFEDFIILMSFAVHDEKTLSAVKKLSGEHELLSPTVPVAGKGLFTGEFVEEHESEFDGAFEMLADEKSRSDFLSVLNFKISGKTEYLFDCQSEKENLYKTVFPLSEDEIIADLGAYDGDTIREFLSVTGGKYRKIYALEPDEKNFRKLETNTQGMENVSLFNLGAWDRKETLFFENRRAGRSSRQSQKGKEMNFAPLDSLIDGEVTFIKMDIEGAEAKALDGAKNLIEKYRPKLYVCAYHRNEDMFVLPKKIKALCPKYSIYYRHHPYIPAWESNFYCLCE